MTRIGRVVTAMGLVAVLAGCYEHTYTVGAGAPAGTLVYDHWQNPWLGGLIGEIDVEVGEVCPSGNATIHNEQSFLNGLVTALTVGIYTPTEVKIRCDTGQQDDLALSAEEVGRIMLAPAFLNRVETLLPVRFQEARLGVRAFEDR